MDCYREMSIAILKSDLEYFYDMNDGIAMKKAAYKDDTRDLNIIQHLDRIILFYDLYNLTKEKFFKTSIIPREHIELTYYSMIFKSKIHDSWWEHMDHYKKILI